MCIFRLCGVEMQIEGMTCRHCVRNVEDALNSLEGVWAKVDLGKKTAEVRLKQETDEHELVKAVFDAGYAVSAVKKQGVLKVFYYDSCMVSMFGRYRR